MEDPEVAALRAQQQAAMGGMNQQAAQAQQAQQQKLQQEEMEASILQQILEPDAYERLCRIKMVKADKVSKVTQTLVARAKAGQIRAKIDDAQLVEILGDAGASERSVTVENMRKRNAFDEDADDMDDY